MIRRLLSWLVRFFRIRKGPRTWREQFAETTRTTAEKSNAGPAGWGGW